MAGIAKGVKQHETDRRRDISAPVLGSDKPSENHVESELSEKSRAISYVVRHHDKLAWVRSFVEEVIAMHGYNDVMRVEP